MSVIADARRDPAVLRRAIAAGFVGTVIEWYDFIIFGTVSVIAFSKVFYPEQTPFIALLLSFSRLGSLLGPSAASSSATSVTASDDDTR